MSQFEIRPARAADWEIIVEFNRRLAEETEETVLEPEKLASGVQRLLSDVSKGRYFVACRSDDGQVIGQLMHTREWSDWRNGDIWWLQSVYVIHEYRRQGVLKQLYAHLRAEAETDPDVAGIRLYVENENHAAQQTYVRLGLRRAGYHVMEMFF